MTTLSSKAVREVVEKCLYTDDELSALGPVPKDAVLVDGIVRNFGFHPGRLAENRDQIQALTNELDPNFNINLGGGWSFLNMPMDHAGNQWGEQIDAEALLAVAIGAGVGGYLMPRDLWPSLPGGMPYVWFGQKGV